MTKQIAHASSTGDAGLDTRRVEFGIGIGAGNVKPNSLIIYYSAAIDLGLAKLSFLPAGLIFSLPSCRPNSGLPGRE